MAFPPLSPRPVTNLSLLTSNRVVLGSFELLSYSGGEVKFNVSPMKAYESETQYFKGDGRLVNENIICTIRITGVTEYSRAANMTTILNWLRFTRIIQIGGLSLRIAGAAGIRSWAPISEGDAKVEIEFIPTSASFSDDILRFINGEIWEFRYAGGAIYPAAASASLTGFLPALYLGATTDVYYGANLVLYGSDVVTYDASSSSVGITANAAVTNVGAYAPSAAVSGTTLIGTSSTSSSLTTHPKVPNSTTGDKYVDGSVVSSGDGNSLATAYKTIQEGLAVLGNGQTLIVKGGTYNITGGGIWRETAWANKTYVKAYGTDRVILNGSGINYDSSVITFQGAANEVWHRFHVRDRQAGGLNNGQTVRFTEWADSCILSDFWVSHCALTGIYGFECRNITVQDSAVWRLGDGTSTNTNVPDGIAFTANNGNASDNCWAVRTFVGNAPDDSYDLYRAVNSGFLDCVSYESGVYWNGNFGSDGNGYKMGGGNVSGDNVVRGSLAVDSRNSSFDGNQSVRTGFFNNTAVGSGEYGFDMNGDVSSQTNTAKNNIAYSNTFNEYSGVYVSDTYNTWNQGNPNPLFANTAAFDWSLGAGSPCIGAGEGGVNQGASSLALAIAKEWIAKDLT